MAIVTMSSTRVKPPCFMRSERWALQMVFTPKLSDPKKFVTRFGAEVLVLPDRRRTVFEGYVYTL